MRSALFKIRKIFGFLSEYSQDLWLYLRHNGNSPLEPISLRRSSKTLIEAHTIEKGLALPQPREYFGQEKIRQLLKLNEQWKPQEGDLSRKMLVGALRHYRESFSSAPPPDAGLAARIDAFLKAHEFHQAEGGVTTVAPDVLASDPAAAALIANRFSAREFGSRAMDDLEITTVVQLAQNAPSQCNRQSVRLHVYRNRDDIDQLLALQSGANGFAQTVPTLFVVTSQITSWGGPQQRNQLYVDGGIYLQTLLLSLSACGFANCPLNLALPNKAERRIKQLGHIPQRERLIAMVAAGPPPSHAYRAACSPRWSVEQVCTLHS